MLHVQQGISWVTWLVGDEAQKLLIVVTPLVKRVNPHAGIGQGAQQGTSMHGACSSAVALLLVTKPGPLDSRL